MHQTSSNSRRGALLERGALALLLIVVVLSIEVARRAVSAALTQAGVDEITIWSSETGDEFRDVLASAWAHLQKAHRLAPTDAWTLEQLGVAQLHSLRVSENPADALTDARGALADFRLALEARPTSPYLWSNLALAKLYLGEEDPEMFNALRHAAELGPWEPEILQNVAYVGLAVWSALDAQQRSVVMDALKRSARLNGTDAQSLLQQYDRPDLACLIAGLPGNDAIPCKRPQ